MELYIRDVRRHWERGFACPGPSGVRMDEEGMARCGV